MSGPSYARPILASVTLLLALLLMVGCSGGSERKTLEIADIGWTENTAVAALTKVLLEQELDYDRVTIHTVDLNSAYDSVAEGDMDAFQDVWLPNQRGLLGGVEDRVELLEDWYEGQTKQGIVVPSYMDTTSLEELNESDADLILGIEASSVIMQRIFDDVMPAYNLRQELVEGPTDGMLAEVDARYRNQEPFAFVAWSPHWLNQRYDIRYLEDPKDAFGEINDPAEARTIVRQDLRDKDPVAYALISALRLNEEQINGLESTIEDVDDPHEGARQWVENNRDVVQPWIDAARHAQREAS